MISFRRLWSGPISDFQQASQIVVAADVALPAMLTFSEAIWAVGAMLFTREPLHWSDAIRPALILACIVALGAWLVWRKSKAASIIILMLTGALAAALDVFAVWSFGLIPGLFSSHLKASR